MDGGLVLERAEALGQPSLGRAKRIEASRETGDFSLCGFQHFEREGVARVGGGDTLEDFDEVLAHLDSGPEGGHLCFWCLGGLHRGGWRRKIGACPPRANRRHHGRLLQRLGRLQGMLRLLRGGLLGLSLRNLVGDTLARRHLRGLALTGEGGAAEACLA
jgi:hypothetical protein